MSLKKALAFESNISIPDHNKFNKKVLTTKNAILKGYWQSEKYFSDSEVQKQLREDFAPLNTIEYFDEYKRLIDDINNHNSVSIHIRRTDYLKNNGLYADICTPPHIMNAQQNI